jgi:hypothetical protein
MKGSIVTQSVLARGMTSAAVVAATAMLLAYPIASAEAAPAPRGPLVSARAALHDWACGSIADQKFSCTRTTDAGGAGFTLVLRPTRDLPKWQEDPELQPQVAYVARHWFLTVQPNPGLSDEDFTAVKRAVSHGRR